MAARGMAAETSFRRLVSGASAKKTWTLTFDETTRPYQHSPGARTGMDALVARLRTALETGPMVGSLDGRSASHPEAATFVSWPARVPQNCLPSVTGGNCPPCQSSNPLLTTSMRRASWQKLVARLLSRPPFSRHSVCFWI